MDRRQFLRGLLGGAAAVAAPERVYSFLKNNPLARGPLDGYEFRLSAYGNLICAQPGLVRLDFTDYLKQLYSAERMATLVRGDNPLFAMLRADG